MARNRDEAVLHGILMNVAQSGEVGPLMRQARLVKVVPDLAPGCAVYSVNPSRGFAVKEPQHLGKAFRMLLVSGRMRDEMVVVGKDGPGFEPPAVLCRDLQQPSMKHGEPLCSLKMMKLSIGSRCDEVGTLSVETVGRRVRPRQILLGHVEKVEWLRCVFKPVVMNNVC